MAGPTASFANVVIRIETTLDAAGEIKLLEEINSPAIKSNFNLTNVLQSGRDLIREIKILGKDNIGQIHCTDEDGMRLENNKRMNMPEVKNVLDNIGWFRWLEIERSRNANNPGDVIKYFSSNTQYLKSVFQNQ